MDKSIRRFFPFVGRTVIPGVSFKFRHLPRVEILEAVGLQDIGMDVAANFQMRSRTSAGKDKSCEYVVMVVMVADGDFAWETLSSSSNFSAVKPSKADIGAGA